MGVGSRQPVGRGLNQQKWSPPHSPGSIYLALIVVSVFLESSRWSQQWDDHSVHTDPSRSRGRGGLRREGNLGELGGGHLVWKDDLFPLISFFLIGGLIWNRKQHDPSFKLVLIKCTCMHWHIETHSNNDPSVYLFSFPQYYSKLIWTGMLIDVFLADDFI